MAMILNASVITELAALQHGNSMYFSGVRDTNQVSRIAKTSGAFKWPAVAE